jgi:hypothetical protein
VKLLSLPQPWGDRRRNVLLSVEDEILAPEKKRQSIKNVFGLEFFGEAAT